MSDWNIDEQADPDVQHVAREHATALAMQPMDFSYYLNLSGVRVSEQLAYSLVEQLGRGTFGTVFRASRRSSERQVEERASQSDNREYRHMPQPDERQGHSDGHHHLHRHTNTNASNHVDAEPQWFAVKIMHPTRSRRIALKEVKILHNLRQCPHIVQLVEAVRDKDTGRVTHIVCEHIQDTKANRLYPTLSMDDIRTYMQQLLLGLRHCHERGLFHGDIKPNNLVIDHPRRVLKLIDFGAAHFYMPHERYSDKIGTPSYRAPELLFEDPQLHYAIDVWSAGCVLLNMLVPHREPLWRSSNNFEHVEKLNRKFGTRALQDLCKRYGLRCYKLTYQTAKTWLDFFASAEGQHPVLRLSAATRQQERERLSAASDALDLVNRLLDVDPQKRLTVNEALDHAFFRPVGGR